MIAAGSITTAAITTRGTAYAWGLFTNDPETPLDFQPLIQRQSKQASDVTVVKIPVAVVNTTITLGIHIATTAKGKWRIANHCDDRRVKVEGFTCESFHFHSAIVAMVRDFRKEYTDHDIYSMSRGIEIKTQDRIR